MKFAYAAALLAFALFGFAAHAHEEGSGKFYIHMTPEGFDPAEITVHQGETVVFENIDDDNRWPASDIHPTHEIYPAFDSKQAVPAGASFEFTFTRAGSWTFHDHIYPEFTGVVHVEEVPGYVDETAEEEPSFLSRAWESTKFAIIKAFYRIFPSRLEAQVGNADMMAAALDDEEAAYWLRLAGPEKVMAEILAETDGGAMRDCHTEAHKMGRMAYRLFGAEAFERGDMSCHSGFYHGAMEALIAEKGTANFTDMVAELCSTFDTSFGKFECLHGVGHGVLAYKAYDLPAALDECEKLPDAWSDRSCYGGVYMENVVQGIGLGADPDHETEWLSDDPYFPCNAVYDSRSGWDVRDECYMMQTSWMLNMYSYDFAKVAALCKGVPEEHRHTCFKSYGRDAAGNSLRDPERIAELCNYIEDKDQYLADCMVGAVNVIIDFWGVAYDGQADPVCGLFPPAEDMLCKEHIKSRMIELRPAA